jgi:PAS domain S-box-containing protein
VQDVRAPLGAPAPRFISLKWKTLGLLTLALVAVHLGLVLHGHFSLLQQFESRQAVAFENRFAVLAKLMETTDRRLQRIGGILPGLVMEIPSAGDFAERWSALQLDLGLDAMQIYDARGRLLTAGLPVWGDAPPPELAQRVTQALRDERPMSFLSCRPHCLQFGLVPTLAGGDKQLMVLALDLADVMVEYPLLTAAHIALLVAVEDGSTAPYWTRYRLAAVSDAPANEPRLRSLSRDVPLHALEDGVSAEFGRRYFRYVARPLHLYRGLEGGHFVVFADISDDLAEIRRRVVIQLLSAVLALLAALLLLLMILNRPMNQLRKLAIALPMLADRAHEPARRLIGKGYQDATVHSEIEVLEQVSVDLSHQLEQLEGTLAARNRALAEKLTELRRANELNAKILETAPVVFLIQSREAHIVQMNEFGAALLGYSPSEVQGTPFVELMADARQREEAAYGLADLVGGRRPLFEQTGPVRCVDGSLERITWLHTRLTAESGTYVLSIGLPDKAQQTGTALHPEARREG